MRRTAVAALPLLMALTGRPGAGPCVHWESVLCTAEGDTYMDTARGVAEQHGLEMDELLAMADYCNLNLQVHDNSNGTAGTDSQQRGVLLAAAAQAATIPLEARWSMHVAQGGRM